MNIVVCGSRDFDGHSLFEEGIEAAEDVLDMNPLHDNVIVGGARGPDTWAEDYFDARGYYVLVMEADWTQFGKAAGFIRNQRMVEKADALIAFWDGESRGTKHSINLAIDKQIPVFIFYEDETLDVVLPPERKEQ